MVMSSSSTSITPSAPMSSFTASSPSSYSVTAWSPAVYSAKSSNSPDRISRAVRRRRMRYSVGVSTSTVSSTSSLDLASGTGAGAPSLAAVGAPIASAASFVVSSTSPICSGLGFHGVAAAAASVFTRQSAAPSGASHVGALGCSGINAGTSTSRPSSSPSSGSGSESDSYAASGSASTSALRVRYSWSVSSSARRAARRSPPGRGKR
ncbi:hypothetical protein DFH07DRAFT_208173 [Mycena maculata]|uniref:Uncharacterized protein n=1 Tax=Mycena maculata TaxID=230809 RepID=A0AAD7KEH7_9AGAR|nr:hypothetical protein DFH07DRAFT_208173 [Mycena maculata]